MLARMLIVHVEENLWTALEVGKQLWMGPRPPRTAASVGKEQFLTNGHAFGLVAATRRMSCSLRH